eukprot:11885001-Alexandrium_andersonii.AAC.3
MVGHIKTADSANQPLAWHGQLLQEATGRWNSHAAPCLPQNGRKKSRHPTDEKARHPINCIVRIWCWKGHEQGRRRKATPIACSVRPRDLCTMTAESQGRANRGHCPPMGKAHERAMENLPALKHVYVTDPNYGN